MRRRFGRGRRGRGGAQAEGRATPIDAERALSQMLEAGVGGARALEPLEVPGVSESLAALGRGEGADGPLLVAFAPIDGGDAALAAVSAGLWLAAEQGFEGETLAVAPQWTGPARRRLALLRPLPLRFRAVAAPTLADDSARGVEPERDASPAVVTLRQAACAVEATGQRELFLRAMASLEGLAAKHGGALRGTSEGAELVLLARRSAQLLWGDAITLETLLPERGTVRLAPEGLANSMDRLEGLLRKRLNDNRIRGSEEGLRGRLLGTLAAEAGLRASIAWPLPGSDPELLDVAGIGPDARPVVGAIRAELGLAGLGAILDAYQRLRPSLPALLAEADPPLRLVAPRLLLASERFDDAVERLLPLLDLDLVAYDIHSSRGREPTLTRRTQEASPEATAPLPQPSVAAAAPAAALESRAEARPERPAPARASRFEEVSLFDLEEERGQEPSEAPAGRQRRRRGRRRRGGRRGGGGEETASSDEDDAGARRAQSSTGRESPAREEEEEEVDDLDLSETLAILSEDVPDIIEEEPEPSYEDDDEDEEEEEEEEAELVGAAALHAEREARRKEREARATPAPEPAPAASRPPRRRAAIVAHADRASLIAAVLLARDLRLVEGFWVYPQAELMTFFRSVATDLREETPICVVGFTASPARDTIQAAALYAGRLDWYDHHRWPPEDRESLGAAIGRERLVVHEGAGSALSPVLTARARRSRFSDKLVELASASFTQHDYERWGRHWWQRLGELATRPGERRADIEPLLAGRPSDLAREAARQPAPPPPPELEYVAGRDFRLVHFGGYTLVEVPTPDALDLHLCGRIARERYGAELTVAHHQGEELVVLAGEESRGRHGLDLGRMVQHLAAKHVWIEALPDPDHVARVRVRDLAARPERLDELIGEIAMGRSILEG